ncbi:protein of unknown function [Ruminococcaceae bacterium BL-6]|nr:protein of unknown function [Ruminococcaceae bacterium BL-6]
MKWRFALAFQSTFPARGTTGQLAVIDAVSDISIHVPREGNDRYRNGFQNISNYFNPRSPRGERPLS